MRARFAWARVFVGIEEPRVGRVRMQIRLLDERAVIARNRFPNALADTALQHGERDWVGTAVPTRRSDTSVSG
jgi:hypothetical protein